MLRLAFFASLLAQAADSFSSGAIWITGAFAAAGGVTAIVNLVTMFATRRDVEAVEKRRAEDRAEALKNRAEDNEKLDDLRNDFNQEIYQVRKEIAEMERRLNSASEDRAKQTHDRINEVLSAVSNLAGRFGVDPHHK